jgi:hypothetical protein
MPQMQEVCLSPWRGVLGVSRAPHERGSSHRFVSVLPDDVRGRIGDMIEAISKIRAYVEATVFDDVLPLEADLRSMLTSSSEGD